MGGLKVGRNEPCPCGSGQKHKRCCGAQPRENPEEALWSEISRTNDALLKRLARFTQRTLDPRLFAEAEQEFYIWAEPAHGALDPDALNTLFFDWLFYRFVPDPWELRDVDLLAPDEPIAARWLRAPEAGASELELHLMRVGLARGNSFFAIRSVEPGIRLHVDDLLTGESFAIAEREGSQAAKGGMILFGHVVPFEAMPHLLACSPVPLPARLLPDVVAVRAGLIMGEGRPLELDELIAHDLEIRDAYFTLTTAAYGSNTVRVASSQSMPAASDEVRWLFRLECEVARAVRALVPLAYDRTLLQIMAGAETDADGCLERVRFAWTVPETPEGVAAPPAGSIEIDARSARISIDARSVELAGLLRREIEKRLPGGASFISALPDSRLSSIESAQKLRRISIP